ncbi:MAG: hypothetical protein Q4A29_03780 [Eubacteriales bacterium]|nr:hypothetical protein [Eubacteriales bacterium]
MAREKTAKEEQKYPKAEFLKAESFSEHRDILEVVLKDEETYTAKEVESKLQEFREREVS